jgi:hypothetical protein
MVLWGQKLRCDVALLHQMKLSATSDTQNLDTSKQQAWHRHPFTSCQHNSPKGLLSNGPHLHLHSSGEGCVKRHGSLPEGPLFVSKKHAMPRDAMQESRRSHSHVQTKKSTALSEWPWTIYWSYDPINFSVPPAGGSRIFHPRGTCTTAKWFLVERTFLEDTRSVGSITPTNIGGIVVYHAKPPGKSERRHESTTVMTTKSHVTRRFYDRHHIFLAAIIINMHRR